MTLDQIDALNTLSSLSKSISPARSILFLIGRFSILSIFSWHVWDEVTKLSKKGAGSGPDNRWLVAIFSRLARQHEPSLQQNQSAPESQCLVGQGKTESRGPWIRFVLELQLVIHIQQTQ